MVSYHKNPCKRVVLALFLEHLSASEIYNTLIYSIFKSNADSDRCFSTFIFFVMCQYRGKSIVFNQKVIRTMKRTPSLWVFS